PSPPAALGAALAGRVVETQQPLVRDLHPLCGVDRREGPRTRRRPLLGAGDAGRKRPAAREGQGPRWLLRMPSQLDPTIDSVVEAHLTHSIKLLESVASR